jgi:transposase
LVDTSSFGKEESTISKRRSAYPPEFRRQMVELVRSRRNPEELSREFEPTAQAIRNWVAQADRDEGRRADGLTTAERQELGRLRRENRQLRIEREILSKAAGLVRSGDRIQGDAALPFLEELDPQGIERPS